MSVPLVCQPRKLLFGVTVQGISGILVGSWDKLWLNMLLLNKQIKYQVSETARFFFVFGFLFVCLFFWPRSQAKAICFSALMERSSGFADSAVSFSCSVRAAHRQWTLGTLWAGVSSFYRCHMFLTLLKRWINPVNNHHWVFFFPVKKLLPKFQNHMVKHIL